MSRQAAWEFYSKRVVQVPEAHGDLSEDEAMQLALEEGKAARRQRQSPQ